MFAAQFGGEQFGDGFGHGDGGVGVEEEGAGVAGEHIFHRAGHFFACGPDDFGGDVGQFGMELRGECGVGVGKGTDLLGIGAVDFKRAKGR